MTTAQSAGPLAALWKDVEASGVRVPSADWRAFADQCEEVSYRKREEVFTGVTRRDSLLFVAEGICAGQFLLPEGQIVVSRFFEPTDVCAILEFAHLGQTNENSVVAVSPVKGVLIPLDLWKQEQFHGQVLGLYMRYKMFRQHMFEIDILHVKSVNRLAVSYEFLKERHPQVLEVAPQTLIAQFCGVTPEGFSRFLKTYQDS